MIPYRDLSQSLMDAIGLAVPPVAVIFHQQSPPSVPKADAPVPAGCKFWEIGSTRSVITGAKDHRFCAVGVHTHNIDGAPETQSAELRETLAAMQGLDYVRPEEVATLPVLETGSRYIQYAPLAETTVRPSVVLLFARASQALVLSEAAARVDGATPPALGRPACALIPQVRNSGRSAASLGCCGARSYLDVLGDDVALWGLPGEKLELYVNEIETFAKANAVLTRFHQRRRADVDSGSAPTVKQSLARLQKG
ncbi:MAG TPA: DUF169 domain-containing protein [Gammaproteobacteria bacterium]|nr:DUF169 domain-containing protein [Gammaproteobacteria bacterium]